jgi:hypothetical protein
VLRLRPLTVGFFHDRRVLSCWDRGRRRRRRAG